MNSFRYVRSCAFVLLLGAGISMNAAFSWEGMRNTIASWYTRLFREPTSEEPILPYLPPQVVRDALYTKEGARKLDFGGGVLTEAEIPPDIQQMIVEYREISPDELRLINAEIHRERPQETL